LLTPFVAASAEAASLQQVSNWNGGVTGLPSDVSMYIYVPDKVATNPPILTLIHYCGGTASAVFGQAQGGGIVKAADQYGFIIVAPSSGRCWDIVSSKTRTRDGGGDTHAIKQMVKYAIEKYKGNPDRVYSTGDSSGGMTTELMLALYPDIFKAGASFAGMPAGCGTTTSSPGGYDGACGGGSVTHTAQEWGDIVRKMYPGYTGHRPRVQMFHGDADTTIRYANHTEAIKEWSNLLGLSTDPSSSQTGITLGTHQAKRQQWKRSCGFVVLDAFTSIGGDHGPSDCLFVSQYVIPFLGLDKTGAVDPEIEQCGSGGADGGVGGAGGAGGSTGTSNKDGGAGGSPGAGGAPGSGGRAGSYASAGSGGDIGSGGSGKGGAQGSGGVQGSGGSANGGSVNGGATGSGGAVSSGGNASGGSAGSGAGGKSAAAGASGGSSTGGDANSSGCNCALGKGEVRGHGAWSLTLVLGLAALLRVRRTRARKP
jgi:poly(hydroxyalkanoate) depolymerase family esterase